MRPKHPRDLTAETATGLAGPEEEARRVAAATRAYVLCPILKSRSGEPDAAARAPEARLEEAAGLTLAIGVDVVGRGLVNVTQPRAGTLLGTGKVEEIGAIVRAEQAGLVIVDAVLSPVQQRNLEKAWEAKVLDRTGLILEIFGQRARTKEGRLQVELAHLSYQKSRLVRSWTHLERQRGGFGFLGGPGETQIEADRRLIQERITRIEGQLEKVRRTRGLHRESRRRVPYAIVALVGYTNAGKSTLFNRLTEADVSAQDQLFATLDPTLRALELPGGRTAILSDTVGFISDLPTHLVAAFRATLEEVIEADLILHVRDMSHPDSEAQARDVHDVLGQLGIAGEAGRDGMDGNGIIEVWNKLDLLGAEQGEALAAHAARRQDAVAISALTGEGLDRLRGVVAARLNAGDTGYRVRLRGEEGADLNWLYENCDVRGRDEDEQGAVRVDVSVPRARRDQFLRRFAGRIQDEAA